MSLQCRCDECRREVGSDNSLVCGSCWDLERQEAAEREQKARQQGYDDGEQAGYAKGRRDGYEQGKTAQIFGDEPDAPVGDEGK